MSQSQQGFTQRHPSAAQSTREASVSDTEAQKDDVGPPGANARSLVADTGQESLTQDQCETKRG